MIEKGLSPGERVVVEGLQKVRNGVKVAPQSAVAAPAAAPRRAGPRAGGLERVAEHERVTGDYFFVRRPIVAIVISIVMMIVGLVAMGGLPIAQFPDIVPPEIQVTATYTGADALTIEQSVATPIEQQVNGVDYMIYMHSINANDGTMTLRVTFEVGTNIDIDNVLVQNRVTQAEASLPQDVRNFGVTVKKSTSNPLMLFSRLLAERHLRRPLPRQLRHDQHQRPAEARARRRRRDHLRHHRLRDADLGEARSARAPRAHRPRPGRRDPEAERGQPVGQDRRRAGAARPGVHLHRARAGPPGHGRRSSATIVVRSDPTARRCGCPTSRASSSAR